MCGSVLAEKDILEAPIDYFRDNEKAAKAEACKVKKAESEILNLDNRLKKISDEISLLSARIEVMISLSAEQVKTLKEIKADLNKTAK